MAKKKARTARKPWTASDLQKLRKLAGKLSLKQIAQQLGRTAGATQQKASIVGISLALKKRNR